MGKSIGLKTLSLLIGLLIVSFAPLSLAQDSPIPILEWEKRQTADERLTSFGQNLMGDSIDTHIGSIVFNHTDVSLPAICCTQCYPLAKF